MVDTVSPPTTLAGMQAVKDAGIDVIAIYVPGWGAALTAGYGDNSKVAGRLAVQVGLGVFPILDPNHPTLAETVGNGLPAFRVGVGFAEAFLASIGLGSAPAACGGFDIEEGDFTSNPAVAGEAAALFAEAAQGTQIQPCQYGNPNFLEQRVSILPPSQRAEAVWAASYVGTTWPSSVASIPGLATELWADPGQRGWQWHGGINYAGDNFDLSVIEFPVFMPPAPDPPPAPAVNLAALRTALQSASAAASQVATALAAAESALGS
jgi:hypothetical protein